MTTGTCAAEISARRVGPWKQFEEPFARPEDSDDGVAALVLVCAHKLRDKRCGIAGPMIIEEIKTACGNLGCSSMVAVLGGYSLLSCLSPLAPEPPP